MSPEWFFSSVIAAAGSIVFGRFEEKTPLWSRLSKWAVYFGLTSLLSRKPGRPGLWFGFLAYPPLAQVSTSGGAGNTVSTLLPPSPKISTTNSEVGPNRQK
jgi:hypothetical protein